MDKLNRNYFLSVLDTSLTSFIQVELPFTVEFDISTNTLIGVTDANFRIYNLARENRGRIRQDQTEFRFNRPISFAAGYATNLPTLFRGNVNQAWSVREGTDFITEIIAQDYGFASVNATINTSFAAGTPRQSIIEALVGSLAQFGITRGVIGSFPGEIPRGNAYSGNTFDILNQMTGGAVFVDKGRIYLLGDNEALAGQLTTIGPGNGLLGTPVRENTYVYVNMIFEPRLILGQVLNLESETGDSSVNGEYKVISLKHRGMISPAICGTAITSVGLAKGNAAINTVG